MKKKRAKTRNNRTAGNNFERLIANELKVFFPDVVTSRFESKSMDDKKVDLCFTGIYSFQLKNSKVNLDYAAIIDSMPQSGINVIIHRKTKKSKKNFLTVGDFAILRKEDFYRFLTSLSTKIEGNG